MLYIFSFMLKQNENFTYRKIKVWYICWAWSLSYFGSHDVLDGDPSSEAWGSKEGERESKRYVKYGQWTLRCTSESFTFGGAAASTIFIDFN